MTVIVALLACGADPGARSDVPALLRACLNGHREAVDVLLLAKAEVNALTEGQAALHFVSFEGYLDLVHLLLRHGADLNLRTTNPRYQGSPLDKALCDGKIDVIIGLLAEGAVVKANGEPHFGPPEEESMDRYAEVMAVVSYEFKKIHQK